MYMLMSNGIGGTESVCIYFEGKDARGFLVLPRPSGEITQERVEHWLRSWFRKPVDLISWVIYQRPEYPLPF